MPILARDPPAVQQQKAVCRGSGGSCMALPAVTGEDSSQCRSHGLSQVVARLHGIASSRWQGQCSLSRGSSIPRSFPAATGTWHVVEGAGDCAADSRRGAARDRGVRHVHQEQVRRRHWRLHLPFRQQAWRQSCSSFIKILTACPDLSKERRCMGARTDETKRQQACLASRQPLGPPRCRDLASTSRRLGTPDAHL